MHRSSSRSPGSRERSATPTPPDLADRVVAALMAAIPKPASPASAAIPPFPDVDVLDPSCGEGALLLAALRRAGNDPSFARNRLHGIEKDPERVARAKDRIAAAAGLPSPRELDPHIRCGDALEPSCPWREGSRVLANPPWASYSGRSSRDAEPHPSFADSTGGWPSLHGRFLVRIVEHLEAQGTEAVVLLPQSIASHPGYRGVRERCLRQLGLLEAPEFLPEGSFDGVQEEALWLTLGPPRPHTFRAEPGGAPWLQPSEALLGLRAALDGHPRLPGGSFADIGVHSGNSAAEIIRRQGPFPGPIEQAPILEGRHVLPYRTDDQRAHLRLDLPRTKEQRFRIAAADHYRRVPVVLRQTADRPVAALHEPRGYFRNSVLALREVSGLDPAFLVAILNGPVAAAWHRLHHRDARQRTFPQVKIAHLDEQPFPIHTRSESPELHDRIVEHVHRIRENGGDSARQEELRTVLLDSFGLPTDLRALVEDLDREGRDYSKAR